MTEQYDERKIYLPPRGNTLSVEETHTDKHNSDGLDDASPPPIGGLTPYYRNILNRNLNIDDIELMSTDSDESDDDGNMTDNDYSSSEDSFMGPLDVPNRRKLKNKGTERSLSTSLPVRPQSSCGVPSRSPRESSIGVPSSLASRSRPQSAIGYNSDGRVQSKSSAKFTHPRQQPPSARELYLSDEDYSDYSDDPDGPPGRSRSAVGEEGLLFKMDGYGNSGLLPGLNDIESVGISRSLGLGFGFGLSPGFGSIPEDMSMPAREERPEIITEEAPAPTISLTRRPRSQIGSSWVSEAAKGLGLMKKDRSGSVEYESDLGLDADSVSVVDVPRAPSARPSDNRKSDVRKSDAKKSDVKKNEHRRSFIRPASRGSSTPSTKKEKKKPENIRNIENAIKTLGF